MAEDAPPAVGDGASTPAKTAQRLGEELVEAASAGDAALVESLLAMGAPAVHRAAAAGGNAGSHDAGDTPLVAAAKGDYAGIAQALCAAGAVDEDRHAAAEALYWAVRFSHFDVMAVLLDNRVHPDAVVGKGRAAPLAAAAGLGNTEAVRMLLAANATADAADGEALRRAAGATQNAMECVKLLVEVGKARVSLRGGEGNTTAAEVAAAVGDPVVHAYLEKVALHQAVDSTIEESAARLARARLELEDETQKRRENAQEELKAKRAEGMDMVAKLKAETEALRARFAKECA